MPGKRRRLNERPGDRMMGIVRKSRVKSDGARALALAKKLMRNRERKRVDAFGTDGTDKRVLLLNGVAEGDTSNTRAGLQVTGQELICKGTVIPTVSGGATEVASPVWAHIALVQNTQQLADTPPSWDSIFDGDAQEGVVRDYAHLKGYKILRERRILINPVANTGVAGGMQAVNFDWRVNLKDLIVRYNGGTTADIQTNGLYLTYTFTTQAGTIGADLHYRTRFVYTDE